MSDTLARINAYKRKEIAAAKEKVPFEDMKLWAEEAPPPRGFIAALEQAVAENRYGLIAEIKQASPSKGLIREDFDAPELAKAYASGGATCLSVVTDKPEFKGELKFLRQAQHAVELPLLRKDFMLDIYQIYEARAWGADCVLLIMASLTDSEARTLEDTALALGLDVLVEVHDEAELQRALGLKTKLIGINNRNLKTLEVDLSTTEKLAPLASGKLLVSESGLATPRDLARMAKVGANCFLIGEALMRQHNVLAATRALLAK